MEIKIKKQGIAPGTCGWLATLDVTLSTGSTKNGNHPGVWARSGDHSELMVLSGAASSRRIGIYPSSGIHDILDRWDDCDVPAQFLGAYPTEACWTQIDKLRKASRHLLVEWIAEGDSVASEVI